MPATTKLITYEESLTMPENKLEEIVDGESRLMPPPVDRHWKLLSRLAETLRERLSAKEYKVETGPVGLGIKRNPVLTYRIPDLTVFTVSALALDAREKSRNDPYIWTAPELLVECLSPSNRKGPIEKLRQDYQSIGVPELWLIDPRRHELIVYLFQEGSLIRNRTLEEGVAVSSRLPGVEVSVIELWKVFDF